MAKVEKGRIAGLNGMATFTATELLAWASKLEAQVHDPLSKDDPAYLQRWAAKLRRLAARKERATEHKAQMSKHNVRRIVPDDCANY